MEVGAPASAAAPSAASAGGSTAGGATPAWLKQAAELVAPRASLAPASDAEPEEEEEEEEGMELTGVVGAASAEPGDLPLIELQLLAVKEHVSTASLFLDRLQVSRRIA